MTRTVVDEFGAGWPEEIPVAVATSRDQMTWARKSGNAKASALRPAGKASLRLSGRPDLNLHSPFYLLAGEKHPEYEWAPHAAQALPTARRVRSSESGIG